MEGVGQGPQKGEMKEDYRDIAKKIGVKYLFGRWGISFFSDLPDSGRVWRIRLVPLDGWTFDPHEITEAFANDPAFSISYSDQFSTPLSGNKKERSHKKAAPPTVEVPTETKGEA